MKKIGVGALYAAVLVLAPGAAAAQDNPEAVYLKLHRATLVHNLDEMLLYASEARRAELAGAAGSSVMLKLISSMMPRVYTVRSTTITPDGLRAKLRATGNFTFMGSTAPSYGMVDLVKQKGEWKVDRFEWSGDKPVGFDTAQAPGEPRPAPAAAPTQKPAPVPEPAPMPAEAPLAVPAPAEAAPPPMLESSSKPGPCVIKPVMTDDDLRNCGARVPVR